MLRELNESVSIGYHCGLPPSNESIKMNFYVELCLEYGVYREVIYEFD